MGIPVVSPPPVWPRAYDVYLRDDTVNGGAWTGYMLARPGQGNQKQQGVTPTDAHVITHPWVLDPAYPNDPVRGYFGRRQWRIKLALMSGMVDLLGRPTGLTARDYLFWLDQFASGPNTQYLDAGTDILANVKMTEYEVRHIEQADRAQQYGSWIAVVGLVDRG